MKRYLLAAIAAFSLSIISACGGGGSGGAQALPSGPKAVVKLQSSGTPSEQLAGAGITLALPNGVTPALNQDGSVAGTVVAVTGVAAPGTVVTPSYTPATTNAKATLHFAMASSVAAGYGAGEFATITLNTAAGSHPAEQDFQITTFSPISLSGHAVTGLSPALTLNLQ